MNSWKNSKASPGGKKIPIIVISSEKKGEDKDKALKLGAWAYVEKAKPEALQGLIEHALGGKSH